MLNTDEFIKRLEKLLDYYQISASAFADRVGVQRSSLSHLLSGRNKPSLDLILKITEEFKEVDLYWIINGKGSFPKSDQKIIVADSILVGNKKEPIHQPPTQNDLFSEKEQIPNTSLKENEFQKNSNTENFNPTNNDDVIDYFVVFYKDGTFKKYISK